MNDINNKKIFEVAIKTIKKEIELEQEKIKLEIKEKNVKLEEQKSSLEARIKEIEQEKIATDRHNEKVDEIIKENEKLEEKISNVNEKVSDAKFKISDLVMKIDLLKSFNAEIVSKQTDELNNNFKHVKIELVSYNRTTGEVRDVFNVKFDNGKNWVDYELCSLGEKQSIGIEIGEMIAKQKNINLPLFLDDAQSLTIAFKTDRQIIKALTSEE